MGFVPDDRWVGGPQLPIHRPPTRKETWEHYHHIFDGLKPHGAIVAFARGQWAWIYIRWVNFHEWVKPPDWVEGMEYDVSLEPLVFEAGAGYEAVLKRLPKGAT